MSDVLRRGIIQTSESNTRYCSVESSASNVLNRCHWLRRAERADPKKRLNVNVHNVYSHIDLSAAEWRTAAARLAQDSHLVDTRCHGHRMKGYNTIWLLWIKFDYPFVHWPAFSGALSSISRSSQGFPQWTDKTWGLVPSLHPTEPAVAMWHKLLWGNVFVFRW